MKAHVLKVLILTGEGAYGGSRKRKSTAWPKTGRCFFFYRWHPSPLKSQHPPSFWSLKGGKPQPFIDPIKKLSSLSKGRTGGISGIVGRKGDDA
jgi:hypothetical protein